MTTGVNDMVERDDALVPIGELYGRAFDFPHRTEATTTYMIASAARSASTLLCRLAWESGCLGAPMEYLNLRNSLPAIMELGDGCVQAYWRELRRRRTSPNGVFGFKMFFNYMDDLKIAAPALHVEIRALRKVVLLDRADRVGQAISLVRAMQTQSWFSGKTAHRRARFDADAVAWALRRSSTQMLKWESMLMATGVEPLRLDYAEIVEDGATVVRRIQNYLGVALDDCAPLRLPVALAKQSDTVTGVWRAKLSLDTG